MTTAAVTKPHRGKARLLLVEDHPVTREGFAQLINYQSDLRVCGQAGRPGEALEQIAATRLDLVVVDITLAGACGIDLTKQIHKRFPALPVLILSAHDEEFYAVRALRAGARGYVMKLTPTAEILSAIRQVLRGEVYLSDFMSSRVLRQLVKDGTPVRVSEMEALSDRELEVFRLVGQGWGTRRIAQTLHVSVSTIETHRAHIKEKLNLPSGADLVRRAIEWTTTTSR